MIISSTALTRQLAYLRKQPYYETIKATCLMQGLPLAFVLAVASRETNMRNVLGDGDQGVGLMQVDIRYHVIAKTMKLDGSWKTGPEPLIVYAIKLLSNNYQWAKRTWPQYGERGWLKIAASAYNAGCTNARKGVAAGDSDLRTTGKDYGADVLARADSLREMLLCPEP